jgi:hydrophobe/amphiphile efflux-3 (HAE3) family protein
VDYAIQFQSRAAEIVAAGVSDRRAAVREAAQVSAPTIATAVAASIAATLALMLSPVPMVRGFGLLLAVGIAIAFACALIVGSAALVLSGPAPWTSAPRSSSTRAGRALPEMLVRAREPLASAWRGARDLLTDNALTRLISRTALDRAVSHPGRVLGIGLALAALGWGLDTQTKVQTNIEKLVPQDTASLRNLNTLERLSGVGGVINLTIGGPGVVKPATIEWMSSYESAMLERFGYSTNRGCGQAKLCPAFSLPDLFHHEGSKAKLQSSEVNGLLDAIPPYFSQAVIAPGRRLASLAFGIKLMSLGEQQRVIEAMRAALHPPHGVSAQLVGLSVLAAQANAQVASPWRRLQTLLAGLAAVALVLLIAFAGDIRRALTPLVPIALASGWSALILFAVRVPLNPMSLTLGALVIAITTEFSVLLSERHRQERLAGHDLVQALRRTYTHTGAAVAASGVTAIAGFGVLVLSNIAMLRDFGLVTVIDLSVSLVGVLLALPAALVLAERSRVGIASRTPPRMRWHTRDEPT